MNEVIKIAMIGIPPHVGNLPTECILHKGGITGIRDMKMRGDMMMGEGTREEAISIHTKKIVVEFTIGSTIGNTMIEMPIEDTIEHKIEDIIQEATKTEMMIEITAQDS